MAGLPIRIAKILKKKKESDVSDLYLCQVIFYELKKTFPLLNGYYFSKHCGYDFDITK